MTRRSSYDPEWADEVIRRWQRRRYRVQQREKAVAEFTAALLPMVDWLDRQLQRVPSLYRLLSR
jgi:hypothetical protein